jgi:hypothetical protein
MKYKIETRLSAAKISFKGNLFLESENKLPLFILEAIGSAGASLDELKESIFPNMSDNRIKLYLDMLEHKYRLIEESQSYHLAENLSNLSAGLLKRQTAYRRTDLGDKALKLGKALQPMEGELWEVIVSRDESIPLKYEVILWGALKPDQWEVERKISLPPRGLNTEPDVYHIGKEGDRFAQAMYFIIADKSETSYKLTATIEGAVLTAENYRSPIEIEGFEEKATAEIKKAIGYSDKDGCYPLSLAELDGLLSQHRTTASALLEKEWEITKLLNLEILNGKECKVTLTLKVGPNRDTSSRFFWDKLKGSIADYMTAEELTGLVDTINSNLLKYSQYEKQNPAEDEIISAFADDLEKFRYLVTERYLPISGFNMGGKK